MRHEFMTAYPSTQARPGYPFPDDEPHPRAVEMAAKVAEEIGAYGSATYAGLIAAGFASDEIIEHEPAARRILQADLVKQVDPPGDRVPDFVVKALAAASHAMPKTAGWNGDDKATAEKWQAYCRAIAAWKIDPWVSQVERVLNQLDRFLGDFPFLARERQRITYAVAASMKAAKIRGHV